MFEIFVTSNPRTNQTKLKVYIFIHRNLVWCSTWITWPKISNIYTDFNFFKSLLFSRLLAEFECKSNFQEFEIFYWISILYQFQIFYSFSTSRTPKVPRNFHSYSAFSNTLKFLRLSKFSRDSKVEYFGNLNTECVLQTPQNPPPSPFSWDRKSVV